MSAIFPGKKKALYKKHSFHPGGCCFFAEQQDTGLEIHAPDINPGDTTHLNPGSASWDESVYFSLKLFLKVRKGLDACWTTKQTRILLIQKNHRTMSAMVVHFGSLTKGGLVHFQHLLDFLAVVGRMPHKWYAKLLHDAKPRMQSSLTCSTTLTLII
jgi:hypothetical protein